MARRVVIKKSKGGEGSMADRRFDKAHPGLKEGSRAEEAMDRRMGPGRKIGRRRK